MTQNHMPFRFNAIQIGATYSATVADRSNIESKERILEFAKDKFGDNLSGWIIAQEPHEDGAPHYHIYLKFARKVNYKDERFMDIDGIHPKIEKDLRSAKAWINYCLKHDPEPLAHGIDRPKIDHAANARDIAVEGNFTEARNYIIENMPRDYLRFGAQIEANLKRLVPRVCTPLRYNVENFKHQNWFWNKSRSLIISGDPGTGKTYYAEALIGPNRLLISHVDGLKLFDPEFHTGIIFDDMSFTHWPRESQIHLVDQDHGRQINVKHGIVYIPANTPKIFTCNKGPGSILQLEDEAIARRCQIAHVTKDTLY